MANVSRINGARPVRYLNGAPWTGKVKRYYVPSTDATALFVGDFVKSAGSADADGVPTVAQAAAGNTLLGVVVGIEPNPNNLSAVYRAASTAAYVYVADDPNIVYEIQEDSVGGAMNATNVGNNGDIVVGSGNTSTGASAMQLDSSDVIATTTSTAQLRVIRLASRVDNEIGTYAKWEVLINEHEYKTTTGT